MKAAALSQNLSYFSKKLREIPLTTRTPQFGGGILRISKKKSCAKDCWQRELRSSGSAFLVLLVEIARKTFGSEKSAVGNRSLSYLNEIARNTIDA